MKFVSFTLAIVLLCWTTAAHAAGPNILWLTSEDNGPHLGCYGDTYATTPNLDRLASRGILYKYAWSNAPVCAPARSTIITGLYPPTAGGQHMRSMVELPAEIRMFPQLLREAGYYCTNNRKEDYNFAKPGQVWDESSAKAHWRNRGPDQPFFAVFNTTVTHESSIRKRPHEAIHDPAQVRVPAYHPDTPIVRQDWAQYYDRLTEMDSFVGARLAELEAAGVADNTIVFYFGDHGSGMPRNKRSPKNSGLHVPLLVYVPPGLHTAATTELPPGSRSDQMVGFIDLAPTVLALAGVARPEYLQGVAFLGPDRPEPRRYNFGFRCRMDERIDMARSAHDERYSYVRNYMPDVPAGQYLQYMFQTPTTRDWKRLYDAGELTPEQAAFWEPKQPEELYDLEQDPDEVHNLADSPGQRQVLERMRQATRDFSLAIRDSGFLPEAEMHRRAAGTAIYAFARDDSRYPLARIMSAADAASRPAPAALEECRRNLGDADSGVRYWAAMGMLNRGREAVLSSEGELTGLLDDESTVVRLAAAEAIVRYGSDSLRDAAIEVILAVADHAQSSAYAAIYALNVLDRCGDACRPYAARIRALPILDTRAPDRVQKYQGRLMTVLGERYDR